MSKNKTPEDLEKEALKFDVESRQLAEKSKKFGNKAEQLRLEAQIKRGTVEDIRPKKKAGNLYISPAGKSRKSDPNKRVL